MELAATENDNLPKIFKMEMSTDFVPMSVFSESSKGTFIYLSVKR